MIMSPYHEKELTRHGKERSFLKASKITFFYALFHGRLLKTSVKTVR